MSLFIQLPEDLQRVVGSFLERKDIEKVSPSVLSNPNDIFWKERIKQYIPHLETVNLQNICDRLYYQSKFGARFERLIAEELINDEIFLRNHIDMQDSCGDTLLMFLCSDNEDNEKDIIKLLYHGANINIQNLTTKIALNKAAGHQSCKVVEELIKAGANVNYRDRYGFTPLIIASGRNRIETVKILLQYGAVPHLQGPTNPDGVSFTALSYAQTDEMKMLLSSR